MTGILGLCVVLLAVGVVFGVEDDVPIDLTLSPPGVLKKGDEFTITCTVNGMGEFDVLRIIRTIANSKTGQQESVALARNGYVTDEFRGLGRYKASFDYDTNTYSLTIKDAQGEDGGDVGCEWAGVKNGDNFLKTAMEYVTIYVPLEKLQIRSKSSSGEWMPVEDRGKAVMRDGFDDGIECYAEVLGSDMDIKPKITFTIGDTDATTYKHVEHDSEYDQSIHNKQLSRVYRTWYKLETKKPDRDFNDKEITCTGSMPEYDANSTSATLSIQYAPSVACRETTYAKMGEENVRVTCEATMNPEPTISFWAWGTGNQTMLNTGDLIDGFSAEQKQLNDNKWEFNLVVRKIQPSTLQEYRFSVENGLGGPVQKKAVLEEVAETPEPTTTTTQSIPKTHTPASDPKMNPVIGDSNGSPKSLITFTATIVLLLLSSFLL